jgi:hypothetical protein
MRMLAAATGQQPVTPYEEVLAARVKPLFETLKDSPSAALRTPDALNAKASGGKASASLNVVNGQQYARLVRLRVEWNEPESQAPYLVMYSDNYFDLLPGESKTITLDLFMPPQVRKTIQGRVVMEASNAPAQEIPITISGLWDTWQGHTRK